MTSLEEVLGESLEEGGGAWGKGVVVVLIGLSSNAMFVAEDRGNATTC